jgi:hypothetical protein
MAESKSADLPLVDTPTKNFFSSSEYRLYEPSLQVIQIDLSLIFTSQVFPHPEGFYRVFISVFFKGKLVNPKLRIASSLFISALSINSWALPIDWTGVFGVDSHMINNTCHTKDDIPAKFNSSGTRVAGIGTQGIGGDCDASFQTYIFKLNPQIIVNDGATLKGELTTGYARGGFAGDNSGNNADASGNNAYYYNTSAQRSGLSVNQLYMELYADTALVKLGRFARNYGSGAIFNSGNNTWDRFFTMYDGAEAEMKIGNFSLLPYYAKISSYDDSTNSQKVQPGGGWDVRELGVVAKYDNKNRDLVVSVLYAKRSSESKNSLYQADNQSGTTSLRGKTEVTIIDPYVSKKWNKFMISAEVPMISGDYGNVYQDGSGNSKISAISYIFDAKYDLNPKWDVGTNFGQVSGDKGSTQKFEASYLNPNYQIADLMFRYHWASFSEGDKSIFDSSITNARYFKLYGNYKTDKWTWKGAFVFATALETARAGQRSYHHEENYAFTGNDKQSNDLGYEIDFGFDYRWNPNVTFGAYYGYWMVGDYYAFNNVAGDELTTDNVHGGGIRAALEF